MYLLSYTVAFLSGFFTDKRVSRYWTIFWGFVIFISGYTMLFLTTDEKLGGCQLAGPAEETDKGCHCGLVQMGFGLETEKCACLLASSIVIMSIGIGLVLVNSSIFGADQIQSRSKFIPIYFHGYYFVVQVGIGLSCFFLPQEKHSNASFVAGLGLASAALSFTVFLAGSRFYQNEHREKLDDPFRKVIDTVSMSVAVPKSAIQRNQCKFIFPGWNKFFWGFSSKIVHFPWKSFKDLAKLLSRMESLQKTVKNNFLIKIL